MLRWIPGCHFLSPLRWIVGALDVMRLHTKVQHWDGCEERGVPTKRLAWCVAAPKWGWYNGSAIGYAECGDSGNRSPCYGIVAEQACHMMSSSEGDARSFESGHVQREVVNSKHQSADSSLTPSFGNCETPYNPVMHCEWYGICRRKCFARYRPRTMDL